MGHLRSTWMAGDCLQRSSVIENGPFCQKSRLYWPPLDDLKGHRSIKPSWHRLLSWLTHLLQPTWFPPDSLIITCLSLFCIRNEIIWECFLDLMSECRRESAVAPQPSLSPMGGLPPPPLLRLLLLSLLLNQRLVHLTEVKPTIQFQNTKKIMLNSFFIRKTPTSVDLGSGIETIETSQSTHLKGRKGSTTLFGP